jgi:hypothetical protein
MSSEKFPRERKAVEPAPTRVVRKRGGQLAQEIYHRVRKRRLENGSAGGGQFLPYSGGGPREIPPPAGENAGVRDDALPDSRVSSPLASAASYPRLKETPPGRERLLPLSGEHVLLLDRSGMVLASAHVRKIVFFSLDSFLVPDGRAKARIARAACWRIPTARSVGGLGHSAYSRWAQ